MLNKLGTPTVMLSAAKHLYPHRDSPLAELTLYATNGHRVTRFSQEQSLDVTTFSLYNTRVLT